MQNQYMLQSIKVLSLIVMIALIVACESSPTAPTTGTIAGVALDKNSNAPVAGALISTVPATQSILTQADGTYVLGDVQPGAYVVHANKNDSLIGTATVNVVAGKTSSATIILSTPAATGTVAGLIKDAVTAEPYRNTEVRLSSRIDAAITDSNGLFKFLNVPVGQNVITVMLGKHGTRQVTANVKEADTTFLIISVDTGGTVPPDTMSSDGPMAHYMLDGNVADSSGNGYSGVEEGNPTYGPDRFGIPNSAIHFASPSQWVRIPTSESFNALPLTMAFWFKCDQPYPSDGIIIGKYLHPSGEGYSVFFEAGVLNASYTRNKFNAYARADVVPYKLDQWNHVAVVYSTSGTMLYVNGVYVDGDSWTGKPSPTTTTQQFMFGTLRSSTLKPEQMPGLIGYMDDVRVYNRALLPSEVAKLAK